MTKSSRTNLFNSLALSLLPSAILALYAPLSLAAAKVDTLPAEQSFLTAIVMAFVLAYFIIALLLYTACQIGSPTSKIFAKILLALLLSACAWNVISEAFVGLSPIILSLIDLAFLVALGAMIFAVDFNRIAPYLGIMGVAGMLLSAYTVYSSDFIVARDSALEIGPRPYSRALNHPNSPAPGNVYHIVMEGFQRDYFDAAAGAAGVSEALSDFVNYRNFIANSASPRWSFAIMAGGTLYDPAISATSWERSALQNGFVSRLESAGFVPNQFVIHPHQCLFARAYCRHIGEYGAAASTPSLVDLWFLDLLPSGLRAALSADDGIGHLQDGFSLYQALFGETAVVAPEHAEVVSSGALFDAYLDYESDHRSSGRYAFLQVRPPRSPWVLRANCEYTGARASPSEAAIVDQHACSLLMVARLVERLKSLGRYDDALIIVNSGHGQVSGFRPDMDTADPEFVEAVTSGLLLAKYPHGSGGGGVSEEAVQLSDIGPAILEHFGIRTEIETEEVRIQLAPAFGDPITLPASLTELAYRDAQFELVRRIPVKGAGEPWSPWLPPQLTAYRGYNIVRLGNDLAAIRQSVGAIDLDTERLGDRTLVPYIFTGETFAEVAAAVRHATGEVYQAAALEQYELVTGSDRVVAYRNDLAIEPDARERFGDRDLPPYVLLGDSFPALNDRIDRLLSRQAAEEGDRSISLVATADGYNIVMIGHRLVAVQQALGAIDLHNERLGVRTLAPYLYVGSSRAEVEAMLVAAAEEEGLDGAEKRAFLEDYRISGAGDRVVAHQKGLPLEPGDGARIGELDLPPYILMGETVSQLQSRIAAVSPPERTLSRLTLRFVETREGYNIIEIEGRPVAIQQSLGAIDFDRERLGDRSLPPYVFVAESRDDLETRMSEYFGTGNEAGRGAFLACYEVWLGSDRVLAYRKDIGLERVGSERLGNQDLPPYILTGETLEGLREHIDTQPATDGPNKSACN
jgi:hypothetical protein